MTADEAQAFVHETYVEVIKLIQEKIMKLDLQDREKWLLMARVINRSFVHFNGITLSATLEEVIKSGDL